MANTCECSIDKSCVHFFRSLSLYCWCFSFSLFLYLLNILNSRIDFILKPEISLNAHFCDMIRAEKKKVGCDRDRCELLSIVHFRNKGFKMSIILYRKERLMPISTSLNSDDVSVNQTFYSCQHIIISIRTHFKISNICGLISHSALEQEVFRSE